MGQEPPEQKKDDEISFYSDDSYEYCPYDQELAGVSCFKNKYGLFIPLLDFTDLPDYETSDEEEEEEMPEDHKINSPGSL